MIRRQFTSANTWLRSANINVPKRSALFVTGIFSFSIFVQKTVKMLPIKPKQKQYDLAVIGGGSAGLAAAFEAERHGLKVLVVDYVQKTQHGNTWGLGGTCVNVGCIPKKLMHQAAKLGDQIVQASNYGWLLPNDLNLRENQHQLHKQFVWEKLQQSVNLYIKSINFGFVSNLKKEPTTEYFNAMATFKDKNTLYLSQEPEKVRKWVKEGVKDDNFVEVKAKNIIIATGTRPTFLPIEGARENGISSDDIFLKKRSPGKTLVVGGGYVAVQISGFLRGLGLDVSLMTRGDYLRAFDRDMVSVILEDLKVRRKINIVPTSLPTKLEKLQNDQIKVTIKNQKNGDISYGTYDTVLFATGRSATTYNLNLEKIGVATAKNQKVLPKSEEEPMRTSVSNIYALGDVMEGLPELTSTAVKMGPKLARFIVQELGVKKFKPEQTSISLHNFPTAVFTPLEYGTTGLGEEEAHKKYGRENVISYHTRYIALEENVLDKYNDDGTEEKVKIYAKAVVHKPTDKVLGLHYAGPNAGEVIQGYAVAMKLGLTKAVLDSTIGIHPTTSEELTMMSGSKEKGDKYEKTSC